MADIKNVVGLIYDERVMGYNVAPPFNPPEVYPEFSACPRTVEPENLIYAMVRDVLCTMGLDSENYGTPRWNPLGRFVEPGSTVLVKPNLVKHFHPLNREGVIATITHGSVIRPVLDYIRIALNGSGEIIIADMPLDKSDFNKTIAINGLAEVVSYFNATGATKAKLLDFRRYRLKSLDECGKNARVDHRHVVGDYLLKEIPLSGDPKGYLMVDLKEKSAFREFDAKDQIYCTLADFGLERFNPGSRKIGSTNKFHGPGKHIYKIPRTLLEADTIISIAKLKTHKMSGVTLNMKNMIGICDKIYMPHFRPGHPPDGDASEYPADGLEVVRLKAAKRISSLTKRHRLIARVIWGFPAINIYRGIKALVGRIQAYRKTSKTWWGMWIGNDTLWRTIADLNRIAIYADREGRLSDEPQKRYFCLIDGIIAQEGEGPMTGTPKPAGVIVAADSPLACDAVCAHLMGFDPSKIPLIRNSASYGLGSNSIENINVFSNVKDWKSLNLKMVPPSGYEKIIRTRQTRSQSIPTE